MDLLQLKYFQVVARTENMTNAAKQLHVTQSALSKSIALLEMDLGIKLFNRKGRSIKLNYCGNIFLKRVDSILNLLDASTKEIKDLACSEFDQIKLIVLTASGLILDVLSEFKKSHPNISFKLVQHVPKSTVDYDFDICITSYCFEFKSSNYEVLTSEEIFIGVPYNNPLSKLNSIYFKDVQDENFICLEKGTNFRKITDRFCSYAEFEPSIGFECDSPSTVYNLIKEGYGVGFIPKKSWCIDYESSIKLLPIKDIKCEQFIELYWTNNKFLKKSTRMFIDFIKNYLNKTT
ncbi:LysR family transcriptional regulator [Clostridioides difficile]|nr:LysR family transcriptional regulator [Clostridioides difficile]